MQINNIQINNFGKLKNKNIEFQNGINVISGQNESGKSTLLKFIASMFYGANTNKNGKRISDFDRFMPWNDEEYSGKIAYTLDDGEKYEVYRNFAKKKPQLFDESGNDVTKNYTMDKTSGSKFFTEQTKVDEELFYTSMVIMQQEVKLDEKRQNSLIQKASNIMLTGEDDTSYKKILSKLNKKQTDEIGTEKSPTKPLYQTKQKIAELTRKKEELEMLLPLQYDIENKKIELEKRIKETETELELLQEIQKIQDSEKIDNETIKINIDSKEETESKKRIEEEKLKNIKTEKIKKKSYKMLYIISILLTIVAIILFAINQKLIAGIAVCATIVSAIVISLIQSKENNKYKEIKDKEKKEKESIETKIELLENEIKGKEQIIKEKQAELETKVNLNKAVLRNKYAEIDGISELIEKNISANDIQEEQRYINDLKLENSKNELQKRDIFEKLEQNSNNEEKLENLKEELEELNNENSAIEIAKEALNKAYSKMRENITPKFTNNLSNAIQKISGGKYKKVKVNDEDGLMIETESGNYVPADVLSIGTIDELYLSLRISSMKELAKENMPIILDETFAYFDDERLENVLTFLNNEYGENQILILTCTKRELKALENKGITYNKIEL